MSVYTNATEINLKEAVELLLKRGNDLFHCPIAVAAPPAAALVHVNDNTEKNLELKHDAEKIETDDEQFELL